MQHYEYSDSRIVYIETSDCFRKNKANYTGLGFRVWKCAGVLLFIICKIDLDYKNSYLSVWKDFQAEEVTGIRTAKMAAGKQEGKKIL